MNKKHDRNGLEKCLTILVVTVVAWGLIAAAQGPLLIYNGTLQNNLNGNGHNITNATYYGNGQYLTNIASGYSPTADLNMHGYSVTNANLITATNTVTAPLFQNNQLTTNDVIICIGDSVTLGNGSSTQGGDFHTGYPGQLSSLVPGVKVYSYGVAGSTAGPIGNSGSGMAVLAASAPTGYKYLNGSFVANTSGAVSTSVSTTGTTYWVVSFGINDTFSETVSNFQSYLESIISTVRGYGSSNNKVILSTVLPSTSFNRASSYSQYGEMVSATVGSSYNSSYADAVNDWGSLLNNSSANIATIFRFSDGIHPNDRGYQMLAQKTLQTLRTLPVLPTSTGFVTRGIGLVDENGNAAITTSTTSGGGGRALWNDVASGVTSTIIYEVPGTADPLSGNAQSGVQINDQYAGTVMTFPDYNASTPTFTDTGAYWSVYGYYGTNSVGNIKMKVDGNNAYSGTNISMEFTPKGTGKVILDGGVTTSGTYTGNGSGLTNVAAVSFSGSLAGDVTGTQGATTVGKINGTSLAGLASGLVFNTTSTGVPTIATANQVGTALTGTTTALNLTGSAVTATTQSSFNNSTAVATTAYVDTKIQRVVQQIFTASGTYTPTAGMLYATIEIYGGGGAGGGAATTTTGQFSAGAGGGNGNYCKGTFTAATIGASQTVTIGAGGAGVTGTTGNTGGATSVGSLISANGGLGGGGSGASSTVTSIGFVQNSPAVNSSANYICVVGTPGGPLYMFPTLAISVGGAGTGPGGGKIQASGVGNAATGTAGGGGGGASDFASASATAGGAGAPGSALITEYLSH